jgi:hypothetical protein
VPLRTLLADETVDTIWAELVYTEARLGEDLDAQDLAPIFEKLVARAMEVRIAQLEAWRRELLAQAAVDSADDFLDDVVEAIARAILVLVKQDRKDARFLRYFSEPPSVIIRMGLQAETERVRGWVPSLRSEPAKELQAEGERLEVAVAKGDAALEKRVRAASLRADQRVRGILGFVDDVNAARLSAYGVLAQRAAERGLGRSWPDRFFKHLERSPKAAKTVPKPPTPAPAATPIS